MNSLYSKLPTIKLSQLKKCYSGLLFLLLANFLIAQDTPCVDSLGMNDCQGSYILSMPSTMALCGAQPCPPTVMNESCATVATSFTTDTFLLADNSKRVVLNWIILDWCNVGTDSIGIGPLPLPYLDLNNDGIGGDPYDVIVRNDSVFLDIANQDLLFFSPYSGFFTYSSETVFTIADLNISVFNDQNQNCVKNEAEVGLADWPIRTIAYPSRTVLDLKVDKNGQFAGPVFFPASDEMVDIFVLNSLNNNGNCPTRFELTLGAQTLDPVIINLPVYLQQDCDLLTVDLATPFLRRCFSNTYTVHYCNYSANSIMDGRVELTLDEYLSIESSELPYTNPMPGLYIFDLAELPSGFCEDFTFQAKVSCDAALGQTHCSEVHIYPDEVCDPTDPQWTGASIEVAGLCDQDSVRFRIQNTGNSDMLKESGFIVTEDVLMYSRGAFQLNAGEHTEIALAATGATYHLIAEQEDFHPGYKEPIEFVEGCGGLNTTGLPNALRSGKTDPFFSKDCQENIGAYDPNDKGATPVGIGNEHFIKKNTDLTYKIRFQNTGTDTAFNVVILDTLSSLLDATSVIPGASSHDYQFQILRDSLTNAAILQFSFDNIMLPDSNINEPASNGFVQFLIAQQPELADGHLIENAAAIYFDFNEPVITNTVFHTIGMPLGRFITSIPTSSLDLRKVSIQPNPFSEYTLLTIAGKPIPQGELKLYNSLGSLVQIQAFSGNELTINRDNLPSGFYIYTVESDSQLMATGKIQMSLK